MEFIIAAINSLIESVGSAMEWAFSRLAFSPFKAVTESLNNSISGFPDWVAMLNWVIPVAEMVAVLEAWGLCIGLWYVASILLRWLKAVE